MKKVLIITGIVVLLVFITSILHWGKSASSTEVATADTAVVDSVKVVDTTVVVDTAKVVDTVK